MPGYKPAEERFDAKYRVDRKSGCWMWQGSTVTGGYGMLGGSRGAPNVLAHRFSYERFIGPIPEGKIVRHTCDNPRCVNPKHLELGDHAVNMKDMEKKGRARVLSSSEVKEMLRLLKKGHSQTKVAALFAVNRSTLQRALERAAKGDYGPRSPLSVFQARYTKLTETDKAEILARLARGDKIMRIAADYNCDRKTIRNLRDRSSTS